MGSFMEVPNGIVPEVLRTNNYENWKVWMKSYLLGQGLWDIVDGPESNTELTNAEFETWTQKNGKALHAIQVSCGPHMFSYIKKTDSAKEAWHILAEDANPTVITWENNEAYARYSLLYNAVAKGEWEKTKSLLVQYANTDENVRMLHTDETRLHGALHIRISAAEDTPLHVAVLHKQEKLVEELVELMPAANLELKNAEGRTALSLAAEGGITRIAKAMVTKNRKLVGIRNYYNFIPVTMAAINGHKEMVAYLFSETPKELLTNDDDDNGVTFLTSLITADMYGVAFDLLRLYPHLGTDHSLIGFAALKALARKPAAFTSGNNLRFWQRLIYSAIMVQSFDASGYINDDIENPCKRSIDQGPVTTQERKRSGHSRVQNFLLPAQLQSVLQGLNGLVWSVLKLVPGIKQIYDEKLIHTQALELLERICCNLHISEESELSRVGSILFDANEFGNVEFFEHMTNSFPILIHAKNENNQTIFLSAIMHRQEGIFNHLNHRMHKQSMENNSNVDKFVNNILHQAGMLAPCSRLSTTTGAAMQMQRELQWFQEVENHVMPFLKESENIKGQTPRALFTEQHKDLLKEGEKWMKDTASSCMVVATLIATVVFAAAFTVPGGNTSDEGIPIFLKHTSFMVFIISDALSLVSSSTSVLVFLSILITSRYAEEDFLKPLPKRMIIGLATLFFSIVTMMVAFVATLFIVLHERISWVAIPVSALASVPVTLFGILQFPLFWEMVTSTYGSGIFNPKTKGIFNPKTKRLF